MVNKHNSIEEEAMSGRCSNVLLAALGTTPQIITESLYHLWVQQKKPINEVHLITTTVGKQKAEERLFQNGLGPFYSFCSDYGISATEIRIKYHLICGADRHQLQDIRTEQDNISAADFFLKIVRELTGRKGCCILATLAGGRKTMSAYLYFAMQLLARPQDKLYHILVQPEKIESNRDFFYPPANTKELQLIDRNKNPFTVLVKDIRLEMAEIPFVRLSHVLAEGAIRSAETFSQMVALTQEEIDRAQFEPTLEIDLPNQLIMVHKRDKTWEIKLPPTQMVFYDYLCRNTEYVNTKDNAEKAAPEIMRVYQREYAVEGVNESSFHNEALQRFRTKINGKFKKQINNVFVLDWVQIHTTTTYRNHCFSIKISPDKISRKYTP
ncbi:MAG: CRISPR-associated ring nuclease Csm6 [Calditrichia bacterium]